MKITPNYTDRPTYLGLHELKLFSYFTEISLKVFESYLHNNLRFYIPDAKKIQLNKKITKLFVIRDSLK